MVSSPKLEDPEFAEPRMTGIFCPTHGDYFICSNILLFVAVLSRAPPLASVG